MAKEFKVGDDVWSMANGWSVVDIGLNYRYPLRIGVFNYTKDGKLHISDKHPTLLDHDPINGTKPPKRVEYIDYLGVRIPKPESGYPKEGVVFYYRDEEGGWMSSDWTDNAWERNIFKYGIWLDEELAKEAIEKINNVLEVNK